jgi:hypothetical protein
VSFALIFVAEAASNFPSPANPVIVAAQRTNILENKNVFSNVTR